VIRFLEEVLGYVGLDTKEQQLLRELQPKLEPHFPEIADRVYAAAGGLEHPRGPLLAWMASGLVGPYDDAFHVARSQFCRDTGIPPQHIIGAMNIVRTAYIEKTLLLLPGNEVAIRAVNKALDLELAVIMRREQLDAENRERRIQTDRLTAMQTLSSGLAHEVRNPLNAARLQLELLERRLRRVNDDPKLVEPIELANHEIERLTALLNDFLSFARPPELHIHDQDVVDVCKHVIELERPLADRRQVKLELVPHAPLVAPIDSGKLHQIVQNLVRNGIEATQPGGHVEVAIGNGAPDAFHIRVSDDGPGIPADVLPRIYEPFFSTKDTGTGMGMAIVHSLVTMHGGKIDIDTSQRGTLFDIVLPRQ
jgi:signal transduction histidine kinase